MCTKKAHGLRYKVTHISHVVTGLILNLTFNTEDPDGIRYTVEIFPLLDISLFTSSEAALVERWWDTALISSTLNTYSDTSSLLKRQKVASIIGWEAAINMLDQ